MSIVDHLKKNVNSPVSVCVCVCVCACVRACVREEISCVASMCLVLQILSAVDRAGILGNAFALSR